MVNKSKQIFYVVFIIFLYFLTSCKTKFDLRSEKEAEEQIVEDIKIKKIIFLGNNHNGAFPSLFLKENLFKFYEAGVRYIFLEGENTNITESDDFMFYLLPAWGKFGYRFEEIILGYEITKINKEHKDDPIIVVFPEKELVLPYDEDATFTNNIRDKYIQKQIIETMDGTDSKAIVFYGDAHGLKNTEIWNPTSKVPNWTRLGYYLDNHYGIDFSTYYFYPYKSDRKKAVLYGNKIENPLKCKSLSEKNIELLIKEENSERQFDHYCLYKKWIHAVPDYYVPIKENLIYMLSLFPDFKISEERRIDIESKKSQQLFALYYLKYHLGSMFEYDYTNSDEQLKIALEKLNNEDIKTISYKLDQLEEYNLYMTEWISSYVCDHSVALQYINRDLKFYLKNMSKAQNLNSHDIWPQYWTAYFRTEKAISSNRKEDYKKASKEWEKLFLNPLFYSSPIIKLAYQKMSLCAEKTCDKKKAETYQNKADNVNPLLDIDFEYYQYFGW